MNTYADSWIHTRMLEIAQEHFDALDRSRVCNGRVTGLDNFDKLFVSTIFSAIAIETAVNDFLQVHSLFADIPYLQEFFGRAVDSLLWENSTKKLELVKRFSCRKPDKALVGEIKRLIKIRNKITHQKGEFTPAHQNDSNEDSLSVGSPLDGDDIRHMLLHVDLARRFLQSFGPPGSAELEQWRDPAASQDSRRVIIRFVGGPSDGSIQECETTDRNSWWVATGGGKLGARFSFTPSAVIDAIESGTGDVVPLAVDYEVTRKTEVADYIELICEYRGDA